MEKYIENYSVVYLSPENYYRLCKNADVEKVSNEIVEKFNVDADEIEDNIFDSSMKEFINDYFGEKEWSIKGFITDDTVTIEASNAINWILDNFEEYFDESKLDKICDYKENIYELLEITIDNIGKTFLLEELEQMIEDVKEQYKIVD